MYVCLAGQGFERPWSNLKEKKLGLYVKDMFGTHVFGQRSNFVEKVKLVSGNVPAHWVIHV